MLRIVYSANIIIYVGIHISLWDKFLHYVIMYESHCGYVTSYIFNTTGRTQYLPVRDQRCMKGCYSLAALKNRQPVWSRARYIQIIQLMRSFYQQVIFHI